MNLNDIVPTAKIVRFCQQNHIKKMAVFGSVLRDDFTSGSDVDLLVEFEPGHVPGLKFFDLQDQLAKLIGRQVDLNTPECLSKYYKDEVLAEARVIYDAAA